jgi:hypothetical protein
MAAVRAKTMARIMSDTVSHAGQTRAATNIDPSAKGSAKMV